MAQSKASRMDESLGMRRGAESGKSQSYKARRDESMGAEKAMSRRDKERGDRSGMAYKTFDVPDNQQAWEVRKVNTNSEQYDLDRIKPYNDGSKGYPAEAWNYKY
jgi:hypothetical protein